MSRKNPMKRIQELLDEAHRADEAVKKLMDAARAARDVLRNCSEDSALGDLDYWNEGGDGYEAYVELDRAIKGVEKLEEKSGRNR